jgi:uncharacterized protein GlcG (DUF336 family)
VALAGLALPLVLLASCGGESGSTPPPVPPVTPTPTPAATVFQVPAREALTRADVERILAQTIEEALARRRPSTIAVTDRVGNVLAVFTMTGAPATTLLRPGQTRSTDAQNVTVPSAAAAIAKAVTGAYLSSGGNAFSTRTASMIVQEHFPPSDATAGLESGPLYGVQFSQLPCSDLASRFLGAASPAALIGPKRSPLGLAADPGGFPLYKNGVLVGGIGVSADNDYGFDANVRDVDLSDEEMIALAGSSGFLAPEEIQADRVSVDGTLLRYSDARPTGFQSNPQGARSFAALNGTQGGLTRVTGYFGTPTLEVLAGEPYGTEASGVRASTAAEWSNRDIFVLSDGSGANRYAPRAGTDGADIAQPLSATEVRQVLDNAFQIMAGARAQIRRPLDSRAQVSITVVDTRGQILGLVRSPDAPIFGIDVSVQKARTAAFFSNRAAGNELANATRNPALAGGAGVPDPNVRGFIAAARTFFNDANAFDGRFAWGNRSIGNIARPYFPDGEVGRPHGPFSRPIGEFSPFSTGLQSALIIENIAQHAGFVTGAVAQDTPQRCTFLPSFGGGQNRLQNGIQIFPGSVPIYRGSVLVGAIGVSGDGIDQDDMIAFLGVHNAQAAGAGIRNADPAIRADQITVPVAGNPIRLRYIACPFNPFLGSTDQNVCQGK